MKTCPVTGKLRLLALVIPLVLAASLLVMSGGGLVKGLTGLFTGATGLLTGGTAEAGAFNPPVGADQALKTAVRGIPVPDDFVLTETQYLEGRYVQGGRVWAFAWAKKGEGFPETINAMVDAVTGEIVSFNRVRPAPGREAADPNRGKARSVADKFINRLQPGKLTQTRLVDNVRPEAPAPATFRYTRMVNGIPYDDNGFSVTVANSEVAAYRYMWDEGEFPASGRAISSERALEIFREKFGLEMAYFRPFSPEGDRGKPRLIYRLRQVRPVIIDALTGELVSYVGPEGAQSEDDRSLPVMGPSEGSKAGRIALWAGLGLAAFLAGGGAGYRLGRRWGSRG